MHQSEEVRFHAAITGRPKISVATMMFISCLFSCQLQVHLFWKLLITASEEREMCWKVSEQQWNAQPGVTDKSLARSNHRNFPNHQRSTPELCFHHVPGRSGGKRYIWWGELMRTTPVLIWPRTGAWQGSECRRLWRWVVVWSLSKICTRKRKERWGKGNPRKLSKSGQVIAAMRKEARDTQTHTRSQAIVSVYCNGQTDALLAKDVHVLISGTCEFVTLYDQRDTANVTSLRILRW